jgi:hypothetical protein
MTGGTISDNTALAGGGARIRGTFTMSGGSITENETTGTTDIQGGGGVFLYNATATLSGSATISDNTATGNNGGGVVVYTSTLNMNGGTISGNESGSAGGGVYLHNASAVFTMNGGTIFGNESGANGGGVQVNASGAVFTMTNGTISGNTGNGAGGINAEPGSTLTITGGDIENNHGHGVRLRGTLTMSGGNITGNETNSAANSPDYQYQAGSGMFIYGGTFTMTGGEISGNTDTGTGGFGGGIHLYSGTADVQGGTISGNTSAFARGIYVHTAGNAILKVSANAVIADPVGLYYNTDKTYYSGITVAGALNGTGSVATIDLLYLAADTIDIWRTWELVKLDSNYSTADSDRQIARFTPGNFIITTGLTSTAIGPTYVIKSDGTLNTP